MCAIPLLLCCQGGGTDAGGSANVANAIGSKPNGAVSDSQRVATLEQEVQMLMDGKSADEVIAFMEERERKEDEMYSKKANGATTASVDATPQDQNSDTPTDGNNN